jgi:hypothetical protein
MYTHIRMYICICTYLYMRIYYITYCMRSLCLSYPSLSRPTLPVHSLSLYCYSPVLYLSTACHCIVTALYCTCPQSCHCLSLCCYSPVLCLSTVCHCVVTALHYLSTTCHCDVTALYCTCPQLVIVLLQPCTTCPQLVIVMLQPCTVPVHSLSL